MDDDEKALMAGSLGEIVRDSAGHLDDALAEFGWHELLAAEPATAVSVLMELAGRHLASSSALDAVALTAAGFGADESAAVLYPTVGSLEPTSAVRQDGGRLTVTVRALVSARVPPPRCVVVSARTEEGVVVASAPWEGSWPVGGAGADPASDWARLETTLPLGEADLIAGPEGTQRWERLRAACHRALAHHLVGIGTRMIELATEHVKSRTQFGKPLASFQAVKHRLADVRLAQECAQLAAGAAWEPAADADAVIAAVLAKAMANRFTRLAREHCQQVLGGMGFTWEHDFHRYARRALVLEPFFGSTERLHSMLGESMHRTGGTPRLAIL